MKSYLRYEPKKQFGVIASPQCNAQYDYTGNLAFTGAIQEVCGWNLRQSVQVNKLSFDEPSYPFRTGGDVTILQTSSSKPIIAVGYTNGIVRIYNYLNETLVATLKGHRSMISSLCFDEESVTLVSGGADSDIVLWDLVSYTALCRLRGHKDAITGVSFLKTPQQQYLVSVSKDTLLKVWDLETQCCVQTVVGHRCEIWSLAVLQRASGNSLLVTGAADEVVRGYRLSTTGTTTAVVAGESTSEDSMQVIEFYGSVERQSGGNGSIDKCAGLSFNPEGSLLAAQSSGKMVEFFRVRSAAEAKKKCKRRTKRTDKKASAGVAGAEGEVFNVNMLVLSDELESLPSHTIRCTARVRSFAFDPSYNKHSSHGQSQSQSKGTTNKDCKGMLSLVNNTLEVYVIPLTSSVESNDDNNNETTVQTAVPSKLSVIDLHGHKSDVRAVSMSGDGSMVATCSNESIKIWSGRTQLCLGTCRVEGYCLSLAFAPGGRYIVAGTKEGAVQIFDTASGECVFNTTASHAQKLASTSKSNSKATTNMLSDDISSSSGDGALWAIAIRPDGKGFMTGGADKKVTFWDFAVTAAGLSAVYSKQLEMTHDVLCLKYSPTKSQDRLMVAVGLLDSTVRVYYEDSLRFFLSLYGHKLPVMSLDISYDGTLLISGSADKTVKIWGLDFGDCHRSLLAHEDSVTCVKFQPSTHYFFSAGKDGTIKYWDADRFEQVLLLPGHRGSVWGLDMSQEGAELYSCGQDRSIRLWERGEDLVFVEEERERALEAKVDKAAEHELEADSREREEAGVT
uniref:Guanine nucleotide-binding protein subunit beta-like protein n=1 Tax=Spumella elongata TaxID=89044 RepID=A0A7S3MHG5_9STRA